MSAAKLAALYRYPVKGLSAEALAHVDLEEGQTLPHDRIYAVELGERRFDPTVPTWLPKIAFLCLMKDAPLAQLDSRFDAETWTLTLARGDEILAEGNLETEEGQAAVLAVLDHHRGPRREGELRIVRSPGHSFSDVSRKAVSIINLASLRAIEDFIGRPVDPLRFRANLYLDGLEPWVENQWIDRELTTEAGLKLRVYKTTTRCAATEVDPASGERDIDMTGVLRELTGDNVCGVYADVVTDGQLKLGDELRLSST
ncbi:molybdenum cofactor sulfurase [Agaricicola taiwanensis]|uniref:Molybdenum cofactor sulfurase n=1 Tax=Agaricicola taiwanensis TaxID=591372 RepID=A0A8J2YNV7_9RHOB|nr:MOSC domain-containing protein [Agaricicola taiwanensis]GGE55447.1 molybdenum cofactor sulfurase [Agaricicola taiwanensis]